jgi:hypothetical protein
MRLVYLLGVLDAGGDPLAETDYLDSLPERAVWLRSGRLAARAVGRDTGED